MLRIIDEIKNSYEWQSFEAYYNESSFIEQLDFFRYEDMHTNFLSSLLKSKNIYGLKNYPMKRFMQVLVKKCNDEFDKSDFVGEYEITDVNPITQQVIECGRLDLFIKFKVNSKDFIIVLENKLFSVEGEKQCFKYKKEILEKLKNEKIIFVFLSLEKEPVISDDNYIKITYQDLIDEVYEPSKYGLCEKYKLFIDEYLKSFSCIYDYSISDADNIPINWEGKKLTENLWNKKATFIEKLLNEEGFVSDDYIK